jgi:hypothetical protein
MPELRANSHEQALFALLAQLSGHLEPSSPGGKQALHALQEMLASALSNEDITTAKNQFFAIDYSDLYFDTALAPQQRLRLERLSQEAAKTQGDPQLRVFVRDTPVRTTQFRGSVPLWANGAAVEKTLGPFLSKDGRQIWFDFFRITRLVALYIDGQPNPAILFNASLAHRFIDRNLPPVIDAHTTYRLAADSVWVRSTLLAPNAPAASYIGLSITRGEIALSAAPHIVGGKLTLPATAVATVKLDLKQPEVTDADPASAFGGDARLAVLHLPTRLEYHFSAAGGAIDVVGGKIDWTVYGQPAQFHWRANRVPTFNAVLNRVMIPLDCSVNTFVVERCDSPFTTLAGSAGIESAAWALPVATIDVTRPSAAAGIGGVAIQCKKGLTVHWQGLQGGAVNLGSPNILCDPGRIYVTDLHAGSMFCTQEFKLWKDAVNPFGSSVKLGYTEAFPFIYNTTANGNEAFLALADANPLLDRPVTVTAQPFDIHARGAVLIVAVSTASKLVYLFDDNILFKNYNPNDPKTAVPSPLALALNNALFKITPVNGFLLFGALADDMVQVERGVVFLTFGIYAYVPTLPDPYAANLNALRAQFERRALDVRAAGVPGQTVWLWLACRTRWTPLDKKTDQVDVSFHFMPLGSALQDTIATTGGFMAHPFVQLFQPPALATVSTIAAASAADSGATAPLMAMSSVRDQGLPDYQAIWDKQFSFFQNEAFALLDVSSNADQMGVSFAWFGDRRMAMLRTHQAAARDAAASTTSFPLEAQGLDIVARGQFVRAFTTPIVSWEPVINLTPPDPPGHLGDPPVPLNYYPDDGGATRIVNNSVQLVTLAPIPVSEFLVDAYATEPGNITAAYFTLPFGLRSLALLTKTDAAQAKKPAIEFNSPKFDNDLKGGIQLKLTAGSATKPAKSDMFTGFTLQMNNVLDAGGTTTGASTLGYDVSIIFNGEFFTQMPGVPLTRIDLSGYGASTFSEWVNKDAQFASTSQTRFDVLVGRTSHEVIQVKSIVYPWGIRVVRTITLFRVGSGYLYRFDSGWKAESDGRFDFTFKYTQGGRDDNIAVPYKIHPGTIQGLFNVQNIKSALADVLPVLGTMDITGFYQVDASDHTIPARPGAAPVPLNLQPVYFDADVELECIVQGQVGGRVPGKKILGFVQLAPRGIPLTPDAFKALLDRQFGSIGGPLDCVMDIGRSGQKMRVNRIDVNSSVDAAGTQPVFVAAARGNIVLPKEGSWSMVMHAQATGEVTPLAETTSVALIRVGELAKDLTFPQTNLLRIANPADLLRAPVNDTINFGFLQSTNTQKVLFLTPAFAKQATDAVPGKLLSKTPPLFVDAYRLISSKAIFPNIGDAVTSFGDTIALTKDFVQNPLTDGGKKVLELMSISSADGVTRLKEDGYKLLNSVKQFDLPSKEWYLIDEDYLKVYVEYKAETQNKDKSKDNRVGVLNYDVNSFAAGVEDRWISRMNNLAMVVDLGPLKRLVTIKGNFDAKKGAEASYVGNPAEPDNFPSPQLAFSEALQPVVDILQILEDLQGANYADAVRKGLKIAMSNSANVWEYKFEAAKEIPVVKFPPGPLWNDPNAALKLEASLKVGIYFNAALTTAALSDPKKLLPTAGAFVEFYGRVSVMCVSISLATVYAVGQVNLRIAGDTKVGPSLDMKFGFGAQVVVGLPVVGNVSVLYIVGVEIYADSTKLRVSAFLLFQGHAELLDGIISITITIEAKGTVKRDLVAKETNCIAQVTFAIDVSLFLVIDIHFSKSWQEQRQIA